MEAIRTVRNVRTSRITLDVPPSMRHRKIEILFLPVEDASPKKRVEANSHRLSAFLKFVKEHPVKLPPGYKFNREELHERGVL